MIGTQIGHYRNERLLGSGGMGEVYRADEAMFGYALSPDQKQLALVRGRISCDVVLVSAADK